jgi:hypothetical protein
MRCVRSGLLSEYRNLLKNDYISAFKEGSSACFPFRVKSQ